MRRGCRHLKTDCGDANAWRKAAGSKPSKKLGDNLKKYDKANLPDAFSTHAVPQGYFDAHHIVPTGDSRASEARALAYRCFIATSPRISEAPNDVRNGIFIRGHRLKPGQDGYRALDRADKELQYHPGLRTYDYYNEITGKLAGAIDSNGNCNQDSALTALGDEKTLLSVGKAGLHK